MLYLLALLTALVTGSPPRVPEKPWNLTVVVERGGQEHTLSNRYRYEDDCREDMMEVAFTPTQPGVELVEASCDRDPYEV